MARLTREEVNGLKFENDEKHFRFQLTLPDEQVATIVYQKLGQNLYKYGRTEVPEEWEGQGIAARIANEAFKIAKLKNWRLTLQCEYLEAFVRKKPEYQDLLQAKM